MSYGSRIKTKLTRPNSEKLSVCFRWQLAIGVIGIFSILQNALAGGFVVGPAWVSQDNLLPPEDIVDHDYGKSVAVSGDTIVVGAPQDAFDNFISGAVHVYQLNVNDDWSHIAKITGPEGELFQSFGRAIAIEHDTIVVSAIEVNNPNPALGIIFVYERDSNNQWNETGRIQSADIAPLDNFGSSVGISNNVIIVGAYFAETIGSVYVFEQEENGEWIEVQKLDPPVGNENEQFGRSINIDHGRIIVGAPGNDLFGANSGSAHFFSQDERGLWSHESEIFSPEPQEDWRFGWSVSVQDESVIVGSLGVSETPFGPRRGVAHVFRHNAARDWEFESELLPKNTGELDGFGIQATIAGDNAIVSSLTSLSGRVHFFSRIGSESWYELNSLAISDGSTLDGFGASLALEGNIALVGEHHSQQLASGGAYVFNLSLLSLGDFNDDLQINGADLAILLAQWGPCELSGRDDCPEDLNHDGIVNGGDLAHLLSNWSGD